MTNVASSSTDGVGAEAVPWVHSCSALHTLIHVLSLSRMTNYALSLLVIFYLQQLERPILYPLHTLIQHYQVLLTLDSFTASSTGTSCFFKTLKLDQASFIESASPLNVFLQLRFLVIETLFIKWFGYDFSAFRILLILSRKR